MRALLIASMFLGISATVPATQAEQIAERPVEEEEIIIQGRSNLSRQVKKGFAAFQNGEFKEAESYFYQVRASYMMQSQGPFGQFNSLSFFANWPGNRGLYSSAQDNEIRRALSIILYMEGMSQRAQGRFMSARRSFQNVLRINPKHFDARADLALIEIERDKVGSSVEHIERLAKDLSKCDPERYGNVCPGIKERLLQVEDAYGQAVSG